MVVSSRKGQSVGPVTPRPLRVDPIAQIINATPWHFVGLVWTVWTVIWGWFRIGQLTAINQQELMFNIMADIRRGLDDSELVVCSITNWV
jgi:hypothetical protein